MGNELVKVFKNESIGQVRVIVRDGEPWFVAKDVCDILEIGNTSQALIRLDCDEKGIISTDTLGGNQNGLIISESGLYSLTLGSRKPEAKPFKRWITHDVIPTIRKTGGYVANDDAFINTYLPFADEKTRTLFKTTLSTIREQNEVIKMQKPKAQYFDTLVDRHLLTSFRDTAKELHIKQSDFIKWLLDNKYIFRDKKGNIKPYAQYNNDLFEIKDTKSNISSWVGAQTLITPKGKETFKLLLS